MDRKKFCRINNCAGDELFAISLATYGVSFIAQTQLNVCHVLLCDHSVFKINLDNQLNLNQPDLSDKGGVRLNWSENFKNLILSRYEKFAIEEVFPLQKDLEYSRIASFNGKIYYIIQQTENHSLALFDLKNKLLLTSRNLKQKVVHAEFGSIKNEEVIYLCFEDNSVKIFDINPDSEINRQNVLEMLNKVFKTKFKLDPQKENTSNQNCKQRGPRNASVCLPQRSKYFTEHDHDEENNAEFFYQEYQRKMIELKCTVIDKLGSGETFIGDVKGESS